MVVAGYAMVVLTLKEKYETVNRDADENQSLEQPCHLKVKHDDD